MQTHSIHRSFSTLGIAIACAATLALTGTASAQVTHSPAPAGTGTTGSQHRQNVQTSPSTTERAVHPAIPVPPRVPPPTPIPGTTLAARVVEIDQPAQLLAAVSNDANDGTYIHVKAERTWYFRSASYLLGIDSFTRYGEGIDGNVTLGSGEWAAPMVTRIVGLKPPGRGWSVPVSHAAWPARINSVWVIGTQAGTFGMGGAPQGIALGTVVFGSTQTYGGIPSTPHLYNDESPRQDSARIQGLFRFTPATLLGGHSAGSSAARRIALDLALGNVWLYGTPNYARDNGAYVETEVVRHHTLATTTTLRVINNNNDPVTNCLARPINLAKMAWGKMSCHDYSHWMYKQMAPASAVCP